MSGVRVGWVSGSLGGDGISVNASLEVETKEVRCGWGLILKGWGRHGKSPVLPYSEGHGSLRLVLSRVRI